MTKKQLTVPYIKLDAAHSKLPEVSRLLDKNSRHQVNAAPWSAYPYQPSTSFSIAHTGDCILLKYYVQENAIRAVNYQVNSAVYEDSCVECFLSFQQQQYYNIEVNCTGTMLMAYGMNRTERSFITASKLEKINREIVIRHNRESGSVSWDLTLVLPLLVFEHDSLSSLKGLVCKGNFYKCGDLLPDPHFLCWSPVSSAEPDFHKPEFFGGIQFE